MRIDRSHAVVLAAVTATVSFGYLSSLARNGAFENPEPTLFHQLKTLWTVLHWTVPACIVGVLAPRQAIRTAASARFFASLISVAWGYPSFTPEGALLPEPPSTLFWMAVETVSGIPCAVLLAWLVAALANKPGLRKLALALMILPIAAWLAWMPSPNDAHTALLARWSPERAAAEASTDIQAGSIKIYEHGSFSAYTVGVEHGQEALIAGLPRADAGVGCVIPYMDVFEAQKEYAIRYNKAIVAYLRSKKQAY
jgi:hypothetical protein